MFSRVKDELQQFSPNCSSQYICRVQMVLTVCCIGQMLRGAVFALEDISTQWKVPDFSSLTLEIGKLLDFVSIVFVLLWMPLAGWMSCCHLIDLGDISMAHYTSRP